VENVSGRGADAAASGNSSVAAPSRPLGNGSAAPFVQAPGTMVLSTGAGASAAIRGVGVTVGGGALVCASGQILPKKPARRNSGRRGATIASGAPTVAGACGAGAGSGERKGAAGEPLANGNVGAVGATKPVLVPERSAGGRAMTGAGAAASGNGSVAAPSRANGIAGPLGATKPIDVPESAAGARLTCGANAGGDAAASIAGSSVVGALGAAPDANGSAGRLGATKPADVPESAAGARLTGGAGAGVASVGAAPGKRKLGVASTGGAGAGSGVSSMGPGLRAGVSSAREPATSARRRWWKIRV
jgi:hypothetical protein